MNVLERLLQDDLNRLVDRIAARATAGTPAALPGELRARIDHSEERLSGLRTALLDGYAEWARAIEECEDLWGLAELRRDPDEATERRRAA
ncbi:MAG TPA: hypothetical protein VFT36_10735 [Methylomirabilota bacterium]|nr:hypothetical protein [Methylomirabilota bacterium]